MRLLKIGQIHSFDIIRLGSDGGGGADNYGVSTNFYFHSPLINAPLLLRAMRCLLI